MNNKRYKIKETIDIFISENDDDESVILTFHVMTTRDRIQIKTNRDVATFIASLDGEKNINDINDSMGGVSETDIRNLINFLNNHRLIYDTKEQENINKRFSRQITFWDDFVLNRSGNDTQCILENKKIVLFGCGSVGARIVETLVRSGVKNITLIDYKIVEWSNSIRHSFFNVENIGKPKVEALSNFLKKINKEIKITTHFGKLIPDSDLSKFIPEETDLIINTCDEPYIGHTSLKIGRYAQFKKIPLYISGGFDAHLMSSGELINPPHTPCIDCVQKTFSNALKNWKPIYNIPMINVSDTDTDTDTDTDKIYFEDYIQGGPGGLALMSGFSANLSCMQLLHFLLDDSAFEYNSNRFEYLPNSGTMTSFELNKQNNCGICNE